MSIVSNMSVSEAGSLASLQSAGVKSLSKQSYESLPGFIDAQPQNFRRAMFGIPHAFKQGGMKIQHAIANVCRATKRACVTRFGTRASGDFTTSRRASGKSELSMMFDMANSAKQKAGAEPELRNHTRTGDGATVLEWPVMEPFPEQPVTALLLKHLDLEQLDTFEAACQARADLATRSIKSQS